jgi:outer membrane receptor protein involved in Fe transport
MTRTGRLIGGPLLTACCGLAASALGAQPAAAQLVAKAASELAQAPRQAATAPESNAGARITLRLADVTVEEALRAVAERAGLRLVFRDDAALRQRVSVTLRGLAPAAAVREVLRGTGVYADVTPSGMIVVSGETAEQHALRVQGTIAGRVVDADTKQPVRGATVTLDDAQSATVGDDGAFRLGGVAPGEHRLVARRIGFTPATRRLTLGDGATVSLTIVLQPAASTLEQVVVTGTVTATERKAVPNAMTVVTAQDIERRGVTSLDQLFRGEVPGVFEQSRGDAGTSTNGYGLTYMVSRGVTTIGSNATAATTRIKTYVDGVEVAYAWYLASIDPRTSERMELIPGPQASTIYGSGALGGVLQVFTKRGVAQQRRSYMLSVSTGTVQSTFDDAVTGRQDITGQISGGEPNGFGYSAGGGFNRTGEWLPGLYRRDANGFVTARYSPITTLTADLSLRASHRSMGSAAYSYLAEQERTGAFAYVPGDLEPTNGHVGVTTQTAGLKLGWSPKSWWEHSLTIGNDDIAQASYKDEPRYVTPIDSLRTIVTIDTRKRTFQYTTTAKHDLMSHVGGTLTLGADAMSYESVLSLANSPALTGSLSGGTDSPPFIQRTTETNRGAFGQGLLAVRDRLFVTLGLRVEDNSNSGAGYGLNSAPRYGASYVQPLGPLTAKARVAYGRATRAPASGAREAVFLTNTTYGTYRSQLANAQLEPEFQKGTEGGLELFYGTRVNVQITHYDQVVDNLIVGVPIDSVRSLNPNTQGIYSYASVSQRQNVGAVRNRGWEGQAQVQLPRGFSVGGTLSNNVTRIRRLSPAYRCAPTSLTANLCLFPGAGLYNLAEHTGAANVTYRGPRVNANVTMNRIGERRFPFDYATYYAATNDRVARQANVAYVAVTAPPYQTFDLRTAYTVRPQMQVTFTVNNIGNTTDGDYTGRRFLPVIGRTTMLGIRLGGM